MITDWRRTPVCSCVELQSRDFIGHRFEAGGEGVCRVPSHPFSYPGGWQFASLYLILCGQRLAISLRLFMLLGSLRALRICSFSLIHKSHDFWPGWYGRALFTIDHLISGWGLSLLVHINWDKVVLSFFCLIAKAAGMAVITCLKFPLSASNVVLAAVVCWDDCLINDGFGTALTF